VRVELNKTIAKKNVGLLLERDSIPRFFASGFLHESVSPKPQSIPLRPFQIFSKIRGDIRKSRFATGINNSSGKFATGGKQWEQFSNC
jgi:hypothetical protein